MTDRELPPAITGVEMRLDAIYGELRGLRDLLTPAKAPEPTDGETIELKELAGFPAEPDGFAGYLDGGSPPRLRKQR